MINTFFKSMAPPGVLKCPPFMLLLLGYFECNALENSPFLPHTWLRYIDDIFMIWTKDLDNLNIFCQLSHKIHSAIKFTSSHSFTNVPFGDFSVSLSNGGSISTDFYAKLRGAQYTRIVTIRLELIQFFPSVRMVNCAYAPWNAVNGSYIASHLIVLRWAESLTIR